MGSHIPLPYTDTAIKLRALPSCVPLSVPRQRRTVPHTPRASRKYPTPLLLLPPPEKVPGLSMSPAWDFLLLQEIHWSFTNLFDIPAYRIVHSGATDHCFQGFAILIGKFLVPVTVRGWAPILAGNLLHVRFPLHGKYVDVLHLKAGLVEATQRRCVSNRRKSGSSWTNLLPVFHGGMSSFCKHQHDAPPIKIRPQHPKKS